jgi:carotenoid cleavage dioxygenase
MDPLLVVEGVLPPDLEGTLLRIGPGEEGGGQLHAVELRDGAAVSHLRRESPADANVLWHANSVLALSEFGLPLQYSRVLEAEEFGDGLTVDISSHLHRDSVTGRRVLFGTEQGTETSSPLLRIGEWDASGALASSMVVELQRATWQHDLGVTERHVVVIESPTSWAWDLAEGEGEDRVAVPYRWRPGESTWVAVAPRGGDGVEGVRWIRLDPCLVTHVLHASDVAADGDVVLYVVVYPVPEKNQPFDLEAPVVGPLGIGRSFIGGGLGVVERWSIRGDRLERAQLDDRFMEYGRTDPLCEGHPFRYGYGVELAAGIMSGGDVVESLGLLKYDTARDEVTAWSPGEHRTASEPLFVRAGDGRSDDEGWLLSVVYDASSETSALYVLDASSLGRRPQAIVHLPAVLPFRSHGEWVGADRYR